MSDPERPRLRELLPDEIWARLLTALGSLADAEARIEALTTQLEVLRARVTELEHREAQAVAEIDRLQAFREAH
jgi:hypothetical protein